MRDKLGIVISLQAYKSYRDLLEADCWQRLVAYGARPQRLLFASTGTNDPYASDVLYIDSRARGRCTDSRRLWPVEMSRLPAFCCAVGGASEDGSRIGEFFS